MCLAQNWKVDGFLVFFQESGIIVKGQLDAVTWKCSKGGGFSVSSYFRVASGWYQSPLLLAWIWKSKVLGLVFFTWKAALGKDLTLNELQNEVFQ